MALEWTREPSRGKHGIYLIHDGIHYNAIRLRENQEEDEQNKEGSSTECTNKKQQRRTKEPAVPATPNTQDNPSEEDIHSEGDEMRATQDNKQENIHTKKGKMRATGQHPGGNT